MNEPGLAAAFGAGLLSFLSPCVLPLVPGYLSYISGVSLAQSGQSAAVAAAASGGAAGSASGLAGGASSAAGPGRATKTRMFAASLAFSAGFTAAFTVLGIIFSGGALFLDQSGYSQMLGIAGGVIVIILGLNTLFDFFKFLNADTRILGRIAARKAGNARAQEGASQEKPVRKGLAGAFVLGLAFAAGWSPCIGPMLASILLFAGRQGNAGRAALLLVAYSLGFALPFLASGLFFDRMKPLMDFFKRRGREVRIVSGILLIVFGIFMATGSLSSVNGWAARSGAVLSEFAAQKPLWAAIAGAALLFLCALPSIVAVLRHGHRQAAAQDAHAKAPSQLEPRAIAKIVYILIIAILIILELAGVLRLLSHIGAWLGYSGA